MDQNAPEGAPDQSSQQTGPVDDGIAIPPPPLPPPPLQPPAVGEEPESAPATPAATPSPKSPHKKKHRPHSTKVAGGDDDARKKTRSMRGSMRQSASCLKDFEAVQSTSYVSSSDSESDRDAGEAVSKSPTSSKKKASKKKATKKKRGSVSGDSQPASDNDADAPGTGAANDGADDGADGNDDGDDDDDDSTSAGETSPRDADAAAVLQRALAGGVAGAPLLVSAAAAATCGAVAHDVAEEHAHLNAPAARDPSAFVESLTPVAAATPRGVLTYAGLVTPFACPRPSVAIGDRMLYSRYVNEKSYKRFVKRHSGSGSGSSKRGFDIEGYLSGLQAMIDKAKAAAAAAAAGAEGAADGAAAEKANAEVEELQKLKEEFSRSTVRFAVWPQRNRRNAAFVRALDTKRGDAVQRREGARHYYRWSVEMRDTLAAPYRVFSPSGFQYSSARYGKGLEYVAGAWHDAAFQVREPAMSQFDLRLSCENLGDCVQRFVADSPKLTVLDQESRSLLALYPKPDFAYNAFGLLDLQRDLALPAVSKDAQRRSTAAAAAATTGGEEATPVAQRVSGTAAMYRDPYKLCRTVSFTVKVHDLTFDKVPDFFEPLFCTIFVYDVARHVKISEDFNFPANNPVRVNCLLTPYKHRGDGMGGLNAYETCLSKAVFHVNVPYGAAGVARLRDYMLVLCITKVLNAGEMDDIVEPYGKGVGPKDVEGMVAKTKDNVDKFGNYRQVLAWSMQPLFNVTGDEAVPAGPAPDVDGESCLAEEFDVDANVVLLSGGRNFSPLFRHEYDYGTETSSVTRPDGLSDSIDAPVPFLKHFFASTAGTGTMGGGGSLGSSMSGDRSGGSGSGVSSGSGSSKRGIKTLPGRCSFTITNVSDLVQQPLPAPKSAVAPTPAEEAAAAPYEALRGWVSPSYTPMAPFPADTFDKQNVVLDLQQFSPDADVCEPLLEPGVNLLFVHLNFLAGLPAKIAATGVKPDTICVKCQLLEQEGGEALDGVFFNNSSGEALTRFALSTVTYKNTAPAWNDTFKLQLPPFITARMHLLFTVYNVNAKAAAKKKGAGAAGGGSGDFQLATPIGYAFVPLVDAAKKTYALARGTHALEVAQELGGSYLQPAARAQLRVFPQCYLNVALEPVTTMYATDASLGRLFVASLSDEPPVVTTAAGETVESVDIGYDGAVKALSEFAKHCDLRSLLEHLPLVLTKVLRLMVEGMVKGIDRVSFAAVRGLVELFNRFISEKRTRQLHKILNDFIAYTDLAALLCVDKDEYDANGDAIPIPPPPPPPSADGTTPSSGSSGNNKISELKAAEYILDVLRLFMVNDSSSSPTTPMVYITFENYVWVFLDMVHRLVVEHLVANSFVLVDDRDGTIVMDNCASRRQWFEGAASFEEKAEDVLHLLTRGAIASHNATLLRTVLLFVSRGQYFYDRNAVLNGMLSGVVLKDVLKHAEGDLYTTRMLYSVLTDSELFNLFNVVISSTTKKTNILEHVNSKMVADTLTGSSVAARNTVLSTLVDSLIKLDVDVRLVGSESGRALREKIYSYYRAPLNAVLKSLVPIDSDLWLFDPEKTAEHAKSWTLTSNRLLSIFALAVLKNNFSYYGQVASLAAHKVPLVSVLKIFKLAMATFTMGYAPVLKQYEQYVPDSVLTSALSYKHTSKRGAHAHVGSMAGSPLGSVSSYSLESGSLSASKRRLGAASSLSLSRSEALLENVRYESDAMGKLRSKARAVFPFVESDEQQRLLKSEAILLTLRFMRAYMEQLGADEMEFDVAECFVLAFIEMVKHRGIECSDVVYNDIYQTMILFMRKFYVKVLDYVKENKLSAVLQDLFYEVIQDCIVQRDSLRRFKPVRLLQSVQFVYECLKMNFMYTEHKDVNIIKLYFTMALALVLSNTEILRGFDQRLYVVFRNSVISFYKEDAQMLSTNDDTLLELLDDLFCRLGIIVGDHMLLLSNAVMDKEYLADLYLRIANTYTETPELRFRWLKKLCELHTRNGNTTEAAMCFSHMAAFIAEFLNRSGHPVLCNVEKTHATALSHSDFVAFAPNVDTEGKNAQLAIGAFSQLADVRGRRDSNGGSGSGSGSNATPIVGIGVMNEESMVDCLKKAAESFVNAQLYEVLNECLRISIPLMEETNNFADLCDAHLMLAKAFAMIIATEDAASTGKTAEQMKAASKEEVSSSRSMRGRNASSGAGAEGAAEAKPRTVDRSMLMPSDVQPRMLGTYYRVGVYGKPLKDLNGCEWVYKMPKLTLLPQIKNMLLDQFNKVYNGRGSEQHVTISILQNSGEVPQELREKDDEIHIQLTKVEPFFSEEELASGRRKTMAQRAFDIGEFMYETPFTTASLNERHSSSVADQWKLQTILRTEYKFPYLATRLRVVSRREIKQTPLQVATEAVKMRTERLHSALAMNPPDPKLIPIILQGSCLPTVNGGPMELCKAFLPMLPVVYEDDTGTSTGDADDVDDFYGGDDDDDEYGDDESSSATASGSGKLAVAAKRPSTPSLVGASTGAGATPTVAHRRHAHSSAGGSEEPGAGAGAGAASSAMSASACGDEEASSQADLEDDGSFAAAESEEDRKAAELAEAMKPTPEALRELRENVRAFVKACGMALKINKIIISPDQLPFHRELTNGYQKLCDELYPYIGAISGAPGVMGSAQALQTAKLSAASSGERFGSDLPVVNGYLIPSLRDRHSSTFSGSSSGGGGAGAGGAGGGNGIGRHRVLKSNSVVGSALGGGGAAGSAAGSVGGASTSNASQRRISLAKSESAAAATTVSLSLPVEGSGSGSADAAAAAHGASLTSVGVATPSPRANRRSSVTPRLSVATPQSPSVAAAVTPSRGSSTATSASGTVVVSSAVPCATTPLKTRMSAVDGENDDDVSESSSASDTSSSSSSSDDESEHHHKHKHHGKHHKGHDE